MFTHTEIVAMISSSVIVLLSVITQCSGSDVVACARVREISIFPGSTISALVVRSRAHALISRMICAS